MFKLIIHYIHSLFLYNLYINHYFPHNIEKPFQHILQILVSECLFFLILNIPPLFLKLNFNFNISKIKHSIFNKTCIINHR